MHYVAKEEQALDGERPVILKSELGGHKLTRAVETEEGNETLVTPRED